MLMHEHNNSYRKNIKQRMSSIGSEPAVIAFKAFKCRSRPLAKNWDNGTLGKMWTQMAWASVGNVSYMRCSEHDRLYPGYRVWEAQLPSYCNTTNCIPSKALYVFSVHGKDTQDTKHFSWKWKTYDTFQVHEPSPVSSSGLVMVQFDEPQVKDEAQKLAQLPRIRWEQFRLGDYRVLLNWFDRIIHTHGCTRTM